MNENFENEFKNISNSFSTNYEEFIKNKERKLMVQNHHMCQRKDGRLHTVLFEDGKRKYIYGHSETELADKLIDYYKDKYECTVEKIVERYLLDESLSTVADTTYDRKESTFQKHIKGSTLGGMPASKVRKRDCDAFFREIRNKQLSMSSMNKVKNLLNQAFEYAVDQDVIFHNPMNGVKINFSKARRDKAFKDLNEEVIFCKEEQDKISEFSTDIWAEKHWMKNSPAIIFCIFTGLRMGEMLALTWDCVDFKTPQLKVCEAYKRSKSRDSKGNYLNKYKGEVGSLKTSSSYRRVWLCPEAVQILQEMKKRNEELHIESDYVFCSNNGTIMSCRNMTRMYKKILKKLEIKDRKFHSTRATFTTNCINSGCPIATVQRWLGHSKPSITLDKYTKYSRDAELEFIRKTMSA